MSTGSEIDWGTIRFRFLACNWREHESETLSSVDAGWSDFGELPKYKVSQYITCRTSVTIVE